VVGQVAPKSADPRKDVEVDLEEGPVIGRDPAEVERPGDRKGAGTDIPLEAERCQVRAQVGCHGVAGVQAEIEHRLGGETGHARAADVVDRDVRPAGRDDRPDARSGIRPARVEVDDLERG
jgi:hypothetical protein